MKNILFVCIENSNRSQMAEAFAKIYGMDKVHSYSAGSKPSGEVNPKAIEVMKMVGYDLSDHQSKSVSDILVQTDVVVFDYVITMGCGDSCPYIPAKHREDWNIPDPKNMDIQELITVRNLIEDKVKQLIEKTSNND